MAPSSFSIRLTRGNIAEVVADALATSANPYLEGSSRASHWRFAGRRNADAAVHTAGGRALAVHTSKLRADALMQNNKMAGPALPLEPGQALATRAGGQLRARWVIHCVAPDNMMANNADPRQTSSRVVLRETYAAAIRAAQEVGATSLALPAIGCGVRGFAPDDAGAEAFGAAAAWLSTASTRAAAASGLRQLDFVVYADDVAHSWWPCAVAALGEPSDDADGVLTWTAEAAAHD